jgi:hypothetical protein
MSRQVDSGSVNHVAKVPLWNKLLDEFLSEAAFHERVGRDHAYIPIALSSLQEELCERYAELVAARTRLVISAVNTAKFRVLNIDIGRIADHHVVALCMQSHAQLFGVLRL